MYTTDTGYVAKKDTATIASGTASVVIGGWADIANSSGVGVEIGIDQMAAMWPASLEFQGGGSDVRIGLLSAQNSKNVYMPWPMWKVFETYLTFHSAPLASQANEFLKQQHFLVASPTIAYTNATNVFPYPILSPTIEDSYYVSVAQQATPSLPLGNFCYNGGTTNCTPDRGTVNSAGQLAAGIDLGIYRYYAWSQGGSLNQEEFRWGDLLKFIQRGYTGRFLNSRYFYRYLSEMHWPHADGTSSSDPTVNGFTWRSRAYPEIEYTAGTPAPLLASGAQINNSLMFGLGASGDPLWRDGLHDHWYGMTDYYFLTGDEFIKEAMVPNKDWYLNTGTTSYGLSSTNNVGITRGYGVWLLGTSRYGTYLQSIGDPDSSGILASGQHQFDSYINVQACESGVRPGDSTATYYPRGCSPGPVATGYVGGSGSGAPGIWTPGMSFERGDHQANSANNYCAWNTGTDSGMYGYYRIEQAFQQSILVEGILSLRHALGTTWNNYNRAADLAYGISQNNMLELFLDDGQAHWSDGSGFYNGFSYYRPIDFPVVCPANTTNTDGLLAGPVNGKHYDKTGLPNGDQGIYFTFYALNQMTGALTTGSNLQRQFNIAFEMGSTAKSAWLGDWGMYSISNLVWALNNPPTSKLQDVPFTVTSLGGGNYQLTFTTPAGTCTSDPGCVRVKWSSKIILPWTELMGFDSLNTNDFGYNPDAYSTWFSSNNVWPEPVASPGAPQTFTVSAGVTGLTAANFSVKANSPILGTTGPATSLILAGGNSQTGAAGAALANPLVVQVTDTSGNPVSGASVTFSIASGGGTLSSATAVTNSQGQAASTLTLPAAGGTTTVTASSGTLIGSPITFIATASGGATVGPAADLVLVSGNSQSGTVGQALANPLVVKVTDANGNPVSGTTVTFAVTAGGGSVSPTSATTNSSGQATTALTLGSSAGTNTVTATSGTLTGSPVTFAATGSAAAPGPAADLVLVSGTSQSGTVGQALANPLVVKVTDANGNAVSGTTVTFAVTAGGGSVSPTSATTNSSGQASTALTLGSSAGTNTVTASSGTLAGSPITFSATGTGGAAGPAAKLVLASGNNQSGLVGQALASPLTVEVTDVNGNPVSGTVVTFAATAGGGSVNPASATSSSTGLASTTLTLGAGAGTNTVTASSGALAGSPVSFTATGGVAAQGQGTVTWTEQSPPAGLPGWLGWLTLPYDPVSNQTMIWSNDGGIYSSHMRFYNSKTNAFTAMAGTGSTQDACPADVANMAGDRHPDGQMAIDTKRNFMWAFGGVNQGCGLGYANVSGTTVTLTLTQYTNWTFPTAGQIVGQNITFGSGGSSTIASVQDSMHLTLASSLGTLTGALFYVTSGTESNPRQDMYYLTLNANAAQDVWQQVKPAHIPSPAMAFASAMVYDPDDDVLFAFGNVGDWIYCRTAENPTPGTATALQRAAGCTTPDDWNQITPLTPGGAPPGSYFPQMVYDTLTKQVIQYGGVCNSNTGVGCNQTWAYSIPTHTWTQKALNTTPPPVYLSSQSNVGGTDEGSTAYNPVAHKVLYHQTTNTGAPADWQYDPVADSWTVLTSLNGGPTGTQSYLGFDVSANALIAWAYDPSGTADVWTGLLGVAAAAGPAANLSMVSGNGQTGSAGAALASPLVVKVTDANGNAVSGTAVTFAVTAGGGAVSPTSATTTSSGLVSTVLTLGAGAGTNTVTASSGTLSGSPITFSATGSATTTGPAAKLVMVSGNNQSGIVGQALASPLAVEVTDANGNPVAGTAVTFAVTAGGGSLNATSTTTNSSGLGSTTLTLGPTAGTNTVTASSGSLTGSPVSFTATGTAAPTGSAAELVLVSGNGQTGTVGQAVANPLVVKVTDVNGNPVAGVTVNFTVTAGGGSVNSASASTNSQGQASTVLTMGPSIGTNTVSAASGTLSGSPAVFTVTNVYDLNMDGVVNSADVQLGINQVLGISPCTNGDVNHDGVCNVIDVQLIIEAAATSGSSASLSSPVFVKTDATTQGSWIGVYGVDGHSVVGDVTILPSYVNVTWSGNSYWVWQSMTSDPRALQQWFTPADRLAADWYSSGTTPIAANLAFNDSNTHQVEAYFLDWDNQGRVEQVQILDANNNVIDSRTISGFSGGQYLVWNLSGNVTIQITSSSSTTNAVISGLFFR